jgi:prepilin-type processing-associated H-X9-DG protein
VLGAEFPQFKKLSEISRPGPSRALVFIDESIETVDDGFFATQNPSSSTWQNSPTVRHNKGAVLSFADGHAEFWRHTALIVDQELDSSVTRYGPNTSADLRKLQAAVANPNE